jgi:hypothetical protein
VICYFGKAEYFCAQGLTGQIRLMRLMNLIFRRDSILPVIPGHREAMSPESITTIGRLWIPGRLRSAIADRWRIPE